MKIKFITLSAALLVNSAANAGILNDLDQMFLSNSTASGVLHANDRTAIFGGSTHLRTPVRAINLVSFDPPRLSAGCGGVDLNGGSFTFISGSQIIATLRNVASNSLGLAFKAAIKGISPSLDSLVTEFQTLMQSMNNLAKNSCSLAHLIVDPFEKNITSAADGLAGEAGIKKTMFSDSASRLTSWMAGANATLKKLNEVNTKAGNAIAKLVVSTGATAPLDLAGLPNPDGSAQDDKDPNSLNNRVLISLLGYEISAADCQSQNQAGANSTTTSDPDAIGQVACKGPHTFSLLELIEGGGPSSATNIKPMLLYKCLDPAGSTLANGGFDKQICTQMQAVDYDYAGIRGWVNQNLFGSSDPNSLLATSIVGKFTSGNSVTLTSPQLKFLQSTGIPLVSLISKTKDNSRRIAIAAHLGQRVTTCIAARLGAALFLSARQLEAHPTYHLNADQKERIKVLETQSAQKQRDCDTDMTVKNIVDDIKAETTLAAGNNR